MNGMMTGLFPKIGRNVIRIFVERQGDNLVERIVLREVVFQLKSAGYHKQRNIPISDEYRVLAALGKVISVSAYWEGQAKE